MTPWVIPFDNTNHVCWRDEKNAPRHRPMTYQEEREYFASKDKEKYLANLCK